MLRIAAVLAAALLLASCAARVKGPSAEIVTPSVEINGGHSHGHGTFCPPGQAKKGRC